MRSTTRQGRADGPLSGDAILAAIEDLPLSNRSAAGIVATAEENRASQRTSPAIRHVREHFSRRITLSEMAELCRLSPSQFSRVFKAEQHLSFGEYVLRVRLWMALHRLTSRRELVKEAAYAVGFNDLSYFARSFKRFFGICPSELKEISILRTDDADRSA